MELLAQLAGVDGSPSIRVIVVTAFDLDGYVRGACQRGACGFLLQRCAPGLPRASSSALLTDRELEIAGVVARGLTNAEIAADWFISTWTVKPTW